MTSDLENSLLSDLIDRDLIDLNEEILIPGDVQSAWRARLEEERLETIKQKKSWKNWLAAAAAVIFVVGGTLLSTPDWNTALFSNRSSSPKPNIEQNEYLYFSADDAQQSKGYSSIQNSPAAERELGAGGAAAATAQKRIRNVDITLTTLSFDVSVQTIQTLTEQNGGYIEYQNVSTVEDARRSAYLNLRIPEENLDAFIAAAEKIGTMTGQTQSVTDMSDTYQDLQARLQTQEQKIQRLNELITQTATLTEVLEWETAISDTQYNIDSLKAQILSIDDDVSYSKVSISLSEQVGTDALPNSELSLQTRIWQGIQASIKGIQVFLKTALVFIVSALPFVGMVAALWIVVSIVRKITHRNKKNK